MARLTETELALIRQARFGYHGQDTDVSAIIAAAEAARSAYISDLLSRGGAAFARVTGLAALGRLLKATVLHPLKLRMDYRRTVNELSRLDDRMLRDIGLPDYDIESYAWQLVTARHPVPEATDGLFAKLAGWLRHRALVLQLQAMDDRLLADIGLTRGDIDAAVRGTLARPQPARRPEAPAQDVAAISLSHPQFRHAA